MKITSNINEVSAKYLKDLERQVEEAAMRAMQKTATVGEARVKDIMEKEAYDTGRLLRSVTSTIRKTASQLTLTIGTNLEYGLYVERGRKPGKWPNISALIPWVARKLKAKGINARVNVSFEQLKQQAKTLRGSKPTAATKAARAHLSALYLIGRAIATKGIRQKLIFWRLQDGLLSYFRKNLSEELKAIG